MTLSAGARVGPYEILGLLGAGGMGTVYEARDTRLDRPVAIKFAAEKFMRIPVRPAGSSVDLGTPSAIVRLMDPPGVHPYPYEVAPDGRILALTPGTEGAEALGLTVLMNWRR